jgi:P27 family predicted phage terminase small subunit
MINQTKSHDSLGRSRRVSQGGAGPKPLPSKDAPKAGAFDPRPPENLGKYGLEFWHAAVENLQAMGFIDQADRLFLIHTAEVVQQYKAALAQIELDGQTVCDNHGNVKAHPLMNTMLKSGKDCYSYMSSLGLTPSARAKFAGNTKEDDPLADILNAQLAN